MSALTIAVFSYNRGAYLRNCVASVMRNMPFADVRIYDDNSTDPETLSVLAGLGLPVLRPVQSESGRHGGLYANMSRALDEAASGMILFLQEDMQIVRPVQPEELDGIARILETPKRAFVFPGFMKSSSMSRYQRLMVADSGLRAYVARPDGADRITYVDAMIADVAKLRAAGWRFSASERENAAKAAALFADMPYLGDPFLFYCPEVPIYRNRMQSLSSRIAARLTGSDVKAFHDLTGIETQALLHRPLADWPVAEIWLTPVNPNVRRPFVFKDVKVRWWLNILNKAERWGRH
jgi:glycosyltransferase involved in cell wall biosynthesis